MSCKRVKKLFHLKQLRLQWSESQGVRQTVNEESCTDSCGQVRYLLGRTVIHQNAHLAPLKVRDYEIERAIPGQMSQYGDIRPLSYAGNLSHRKSAVAIAE
jgi:hypothetical protein